MPSSYTASLRFEKQFTGENVNTWGDRLNTLFDRADFAIAGVTTKALTGDYTLTSSNTATDEARAAILKFTGSGSFTVTIPSVSKKYVVVNGCSGTLTVTCGGESVSIDTGDVETVVCDGVDVLPLGYADSGGNLLSIKDYIAAQILGSLAGLPATAGNAGKYIYTNGTSVSWRLPVTTDLADYTTDQAAREAAALGRAVAFAIAL